MKPVDPQGDIAVELVVAVARNGVIGSEGAMPWRLSTDLKRFKAITMGKPVIMGRKTYDSIGKPLPGRANIVITRNASFSAEGIDVAHSLEAALEQADKSARTSGAAAFCVIGGGEIYRAALPYADCVHLTHVDSEPSGDTVFPQLSEDVWFIETELEVPAGEKDSAATRYVVYRRKT
ncbi:MAG: dihydrofolate reductase [Pseudomonadota bacterium]